MFGDLQIREQLDRSNSNRGGNDQSFGGRGVNRRLGAVAYCANHLLLVTDANTPGWSTAARH
jgi:hypothetical protein